MHWYGLWYLTVTTQWLLMLLLLIRRKIFFVTPRLLRDIQGLLAVCHLTHFLLVCPSHPIHTHTRLNHSASWYSIIHITSLPRLAATRTGLTRGNDNCCCVLVFFDLFRHHLSCFTLGFMVPWYNLHVLQILFGTSSRIISHEKSYGVYLGNFLFKRDGSNRFPNKHACTNDA